MKWRSGGRGEMMNKFYEKMEKKYAKKMNLSECRENGFNSELRDLINKYMDNKVDIFDIDVPDDFWRDILNDLEEGHNG